MKDRKRALIWLLILGICLALLIWHTVKWHKMGRHAEINQDIKEGKSYIAIIYNLGLMGALGILLGFIMEKCTQVIGYQAKEIKHFDEEEPGQAPPGAAGEGEAS
jgi:TRAP-type C4-dicarboxylate transport system permease small subunit